MGEGEFKKRIDHNKNTVNACPDKEDYVNYTEEIKIWVDEARKEFPFSIETFDMLYFKSHEEETIIDNPERAEEQLREWFLKWFGQDFSRKSSRGEFTPNPVK